MIISIIEENFSKKVRLHKIEPKIILLREEFKATLRKEKIETYISKKRHKPIEKNDTLEIDLETLKVDQSLKCFKGDSKEEIVDFLAKLLFSKDFEEVKLGIYFTRIVMTNRAEPPVDLLWKKQIFNRLISILDENKTNLSIVVSRY